MDTGGCGERKRSLEHVHGGVLFRPRHSARDRRERAEQAVLVGRATFDRPRKPSHRGRSPELPHHQAVPFALTKDANE